MFIISILIIVISCITSCEDPVILNLPTGDEKLVVDGWMTTENKPYSIEIYKTIGFNNQSSYPPENNAEVYVTDRLSFRYDFDEVGQTGVYESDPLELIGKQGEAYILHITLSDGSMYESKREVLHPLSELSNVSSNFFFDPGLPVEDPEAKQYFVQGLVRDIPNVKNFYRWKITVNDILRNKPEELLLFDDKFTDGVNFNIRANNITMEANDRVILEHRSLTEDAYNYFQQLSAQLSTGLVPNTPPAIIFGNVRNINDSTEIVLGYFGASSVSQANLIINP